MPDEPKLGQWHVEWKAPNLPQIVDLEGNCVAVVHGRNDKELWSRALLIAASPTLKDGAWLALKVFDGMAQASSDPDVKTASAGIVPVLLSGLVAAGEEIVKQN